MPRFMGRFALVLSGTLLSLLIAMLLVGHVLPKQAISYITTADYNLKLHLMDIRSGVSVKLSDQPVFGCCPIWSPDGSQIAFTGVNDRSYVVDVYGGETRRLNPPEWPGWVADWSPDGQNLLVTGMGRANGGYRYLYRIGADGSEPTRLTEEGLDILMPFYAGDGAFIVFMAEGDADWDIYRRDAGSDVNQPLTGDEGVDMYPALSPDGQRVAFYRQQEADTHLVVMNATGGTPQPLVPIAGIGDAPVWSPDGTRILFTAQPASTIPVQIGVVDSDGSNLRWLSDLNHFSNLVSWSPDGKQILFISQAAHDVTDGADIFVMDADGDHIRSLTNNLENASSPAWQP